MLAALKRWLRRAFTPSEELEKLRSTFGSAQDNHDARLRQAMENHYRCRNPPSPPDSIVDQIDWTQAPEGFHLWRYDDQKKVAVWMNGKSTIEEHGEVWEVIMAPTFGARELMQMEMPSLEQKRRKAADCEVQLEQI